ncbi:MAG TPA: alpha/beta fold hydrolase [Phycisphaerae bacterium]|nr:alpha/beta fold hydrolase [Phycisphaerae bacterium]HPS53223.1 alpha/beta fold hydrolase [Phycisphaerae bacterium]
MTVIAGCACGGCSTEDNARRILEQDTSMGRLEAMTHDVDSMIKLGTIDKHYVIKAADGINLDVWVIFSKKREYEKTKGTVMLLHGFEDSKRNMLSLGETLAGDGYDVVLNDMRAHGRSGGKYVTFGAVERRDVLAIADYLLNEHVINQPLYAMGFSMGAATAILYAADDSRCKAVVAIAPYSDARTVLHHHSGYISDEQFAAAWARAGEIAGFQPDDADVIAAARKIRCPLLVIHGRLDAIVPYEQGKAVYEAAGGKKELKTVGIASHLSIIAMGDKWFAEQLDRLTGNKQPKREK